jgi:hypothetical protein
MQSVAYLIGFGIGMLGTRYYNKKRMEYKPVRLEDIQNEIILTKQSDNILVPKKDEENKIETNNNSPYSHLFSGSKYD